MKSKVCCIIVQLNGYQCFGGSYRHLRIYAESGGNIFLSSLCHPLPEYATLHARSLQSYDHHCENLGYVGVCSLVRIENLPCLTVLYLDTIWFGKFAAFCYGLLCSMVGICKCSGGIFCHHFNFYSPDRDNIFLWNGSKFLPDCTLHPRISYSSESLSWKFKIHHKLS